MQNKFAEFGYSKSGRIITLVGITHHKYIIFDYRLNKKVKYGVSRAIAI